MSTKTNTKRTRRDICTVIKHPIVHDNYLNIKVNDNDVSALLDTGAILTLLSRETAKRLNCKLEPLRTGGTSVLFTADGSGMPILAKTTLRMDFSGVQIWQEASVVERLNHVVIIGCDFLRDHNVIINYEQQTINITDKLESSRQIVQKRPRFAITVSSVSIPAFSKCIVSVSVPKYLDNKQVLLEPIPKFQFRNFAVARSLSRCTKGMTSCRILNYHPTTRVLHKGQKIALIGNISSIVSCTPYEENNVDKESVLLDSEEKQSEKTLDEFHKEYGFKIAIYY